MAFNVGDRVESRCDLVAKDTGGIMPAGQHGYVIDDPNAIASAPIVAVRTGHYGVVWAPEYMWRPYGVSQVNNAPTPVPPNHGGMTAPVPVIQALSHPTTAHQFNSKYPNGAIVKYKGMFHGTKRCAYTLGSGRSVVKLATGFVAPLDQLEAVEGR